jgi:hypothetical protein
MATPTVPLPRDASQVARLLGTPEIRTLIVRLEDTRWTGRPGYPIRTMLGMALVKSLYVLPTWTRVVALVTEHAALRNALGVSANNVPSQWACYRFATKLREFGNMLTECIDNVLAGLHDEHPDMGETVAIDGSDLPAYANGQRFLRKNGPLRKVYSDPDASWGHRSSISTRKGGGYYGFKVHAAVDTTTGLPIAWQVETASKAEVPVVPTLLDTLATRGFETTHAVMDKGYDGAPIYDECEARGIRPIVPLKHTPAVVDGEHLPPMCGHGEWTFAGSDAKRGASKWRCPTGKCAPASVWVKADRLHTLVPRSTNRWTALYRQRGAVEREFGVLKHQWAMLPLRVRRLPRVRLHVDLTILARLATALDNARVVHSAPSSLAA